MDTVIGVDVQMGLLDWGIHRDDLNHLRFLMAQADLVAHQLVFHGVLQWGVEQHLHFLAADEAHLDDALAESAVPLYFYDDAFFTCLKL